MPHGGYASLKIWMINHYAEPYGRHHNLALELVRRGHRVVIFASSFDHKSRREERLAPGEKLRREDLDGVTFVWLRTPPYPGNTAARVWNMAVFAGRLWRGGKAAGFDPPDVIIGSSPHLFAALAAQRLAASLHVPFVLEVRDLWPQSLVDLGDVSSRHPVVRGLEAIEKYLYCRAAKIISLLPGAAEHMVGKGADQEKVVWIPNGISINLVPLAERPSNGGAFTVMYAGAHGLANALDALLEAAHLVGAEAWGKGVRFRFIGDGPEKQRLQEVARKRELDNLYFDDPVPRNKVYSLLREADAFVMPLKHSPVFRWGVSPNKLFDYMAASRPVIFSVNSPNNPVEEAQAGLTVPPEEPHALARAVKELLEMSPEERWQMGLRGREYVEKHHSFQRLADKLETVLENVVQKN